MQEIMLGWFKKIFSLVIFAGISTVTIATSKSKPNHFNLGHHITNYYVTSSCPDKIAEAKIRVDNTEIIDASFAPKQMQDSDGHNYETRSFESFGFQYYNVKVGEDLIGKFELTGKDCLVKDKEFFINEQYSSQDSDYWFFRPGYFTKTNYFCYHNNTYQCTINLEELPAGEFKTVVSEGSL